MTPDLSYTDFAALPVGACFLWAEAEGNQGYCLLEKVTPVPSSKGPPYNAQVHYDGALIRVPETASVVRVMMGEFGTRKHLRNNNDIRPTTH